MSWLNRYIRFTLLFVLFFGAHAPIYAQIDVTTKELEKHLKFLTSSKNKGRFPGTRESYRVEKYLARHLSKAELTCFNQSYFQQFNAKLKFTNSAVTSNEVSASNVLGLIEGADPILKKELIILGAHYDHLGLGGRASKKPDTIAVHSGADDNASGTSALLEIAERISGNRQLFKRSILIIAFGAEEHGLLGSQYFVNNPVVPLQNIKLMINMDMIGRLNQENQVYVNGAGSFAGGVDLMKDLRMKFNLNPFVHSGGVGGSDHVSFFKKNISVLGVHTGAHPQYHRPDDQMDLLNIEGQKRICDYLYEAVLFLSGEKEIKFIPVE